jgi:hypothetical protein
MSIDRIGGPKAPPMAMPGTATARTMGAAFQSPRRVERAGQVTASEPLARLLASQLDRAGYVELHVQHATSHLRALSAPDLEQVQQQLRDRCESDPLLRELVARATG